MTFLCNIFFFFATKKYNLMLIYRILSLTYLANSWTMKYNLKMFVPISTLFGNGGGSVPNSDTLTSLHKTIISISKSFNTCVYEKKSFFFLRMHWNRLNFKLNFNKSFDKFLGWFFSFNFTTFFEAGNCLKSKKYTKQHSR